MSPNKEAKLNYAANIAQIGPNNKQSGDQFTNNWTIRQYNNNWTKNASFRGSYDVGFIGAYIRGRGGYNRNFPQGQRRKVEWCNI